MTQKLLTYDKSIVPQETSWWCGPASTQIALNARGIRKSERDLMLELERLEGNVRNGQVFDDRDGTVRTITNMAIDVAPSLHPRRSSEAS